MMSMTPVNPKERIVQDDRTSTSDTDTNRISIARPGFRNRVALILHGAINYLMPAGFEDESGFHCGPTIESDSPANSSEKAV